ncbi:MAG: Ulp1 family isopeptidase, partial [Formivibrio sp.]|nr:Ulp1 family isopeptidase [Formivibrio sp.]
KAQKRITDTTIAELLKMTPYMTKKEFDRLGYNKEILVDELIKEHKLPFDAWIQENMSQSKEYENIVEKSKALEALEAKLDGLVGSGRYNGKTGLDTGMSDQEIDEVMAGHPEFLGAIAADEMHLLKPKVKALNCWIMNTEARGQPGQHWVAFLVDTRPHGSHSAEYYNSLADPITRVWMDDLKQLIKQVNPNDTYLRYKSNTIADQNNTSANCGEFACHFLLSRLKGNSFAKASGWDARSEKDIERWKPQTIFPSCLLPQSCGSQVREGRACVTFGIRCVRVQPRLSSASKTLWVDRALDRRRLFVAGWLSTASWRSRASTRARSPSSALSSALATG